MEIAQMEMLSKGELAYAERTLQSLSGEVDLENQQGPGFRLEQAPKPVRSFLTIAALLADYADNQCWHDLTDYYAILESNSPETAEALQSYIGTHRAMFLDIIANYRDAEGID